MYSTNLKLADLLKYLGGTKVVLYLDDKQVCAETSLAIMSDPYRYKIVRIKDGVDSSINIYVTKIKERIPR